MGVWETSIKTKGIVASTDATQSINATQHRVTKYYSETCSLRPLQ